MLPTEIPTPPLVNLLHLTTLQVEGEDAAAFLHAMLTQDILQLAVGEATRAGLCNAKGRLLADLLVTRRTTSSGYHLTLHSSLGGEIQRHLQRFILRQKVTLRATDEHHFGLIQPDETTTRQLPPQIPLHGGVDQHGLFALWVHTGSTPRLLMFQPTDSPAPLDSDGLVSMARWEAAEILDSLPQITAETTGHLVPQWVNLDRLNAISFKKGCYPGQEVIARLHYLGKPNRQMVLGHIDTTDPLPIGSLITPQDAPETDAGSLIRIAPDPFSAHGQVFLAVIRLSHLNDELQINGHRCRISPIPPINLSTVAH